MCIIKQSNFHMNTIIIRPINYDNSRIFTNFVTEFNVCNPKRRKAENLT